jgi:O-methyltransferase involved in polyketide biosynthesis
MFMTSDHWRDRAYHARFSAKLMDDEEAKRLLLQIADLYDRIADRARLAGSAPPDDR